MKRYTSSDFAPIPGARVSIPYAPEAKVFLPRMDFDVIVVDPPWSYGKATKERTTSRNVGTRHYRVMGQNGDGEINRRTGAGIQSIIDSVPVAEIAAENAHLYLWTTNPKLPFAFRVMEAWGFTYKTTLTWEKIRKDGGVHGGGQGWFFRGATEHVLFGVKGRKPIPSGSRLPNLFRAQKGAHSAKPDEFYRMVDHVSGESDRKIDLFARKQRNGWWAWGDEVESNTTWSVVQGREA